MVTAQVGRVEELAAWREEWCVSAFLPRHTVAGRDNGDALRLKNLLRDAENELADLGVRRSAAAELVSRVPPRGLGDRTSAAYHHAGIASYVAPGFDRNLGFTGEAPMLVTVARRFHLKPLLAELAHGHRFYVLTVTRGAARLFAGRASGLSPIDVPGMPASLDDAVRFDDRERAFTSHSAATGGGGGGGVIAAFHGQGDRDDHLTEDMMRYLRLIDAALSGVVQSDVPLVVAGSQDVVARFRQVSSSGALTDQDIVANPEALTTVELGARAHEIVDERRARSVDDDRARFHQLHGTGLATDVPTTVVGGARRGRIEAVFVASDTQWWGRFDADAEAPELHDFRVPGDEDLLDTAAVDAWRTGARVHVVSRAEVPGESPISAILRY